MEIAILHKRSESVEDGRSKDVKQLVDQALAKGIHPNQILSKCLLPGMIAVDEKFKNNEVFISKVFLADKAMNVGLMAVNEKIQELHPAYAGCVVIGTVEGDIHDIGKNLVSMLFLGEGFKVYDIGVNVKYYEFVDKAEELGADVICMSSFLLSARANMKLVIDELKRRNIRENYIVMIGGEAVTRTYAKEIGADEYSPDAVTAAEAAKRLVEIKNAMV